MSTFGFRVMYKHSSAIKCNDIIAGNGRVLNFYLFSVWLYLLKKYIMLLNFFLFSFLCILVLHLMVVVYNIIYISFHNNNVHVTMPQAGFEPPSIQGQLLEFVKFVKSYS